jgi:hypothetical protein
MTLVLASRPNPSDDWAVRLCNDATLNAIVYDLELGREDGILTVLAGLPIALKTDMLPIAKHVADQFNPGMWDILSGNAKLEQRIRFIMAAKDTMNPSEDALLDIFLLLRTNLMMCEVDTFSRGRPFSYMMICKLLGVPVIGVGISVAYDSMPLACVEQIVRREHVPTAVRGWLLSHERQEIENGQTDAQSTEGS